MAGPGSYIEVCTAFDEAAPGTCTASAWVPYQSSGLPPLTLEEAQAIGTPIALVWAGAWVFKQLARMIREMD